MSTTKTTSRSPAYRAYQPRVAVARHQAVAHRDAEARQANGADTTADGADASAPTPPACVPPQAKAA